MAEEHSRGYLATVGAVAAGGATAGVIALFLGLIIGLIVTFAIGRIVYGSHMTGHQVDHAINLAVIAVGAPVMALTTAIATYFIVEARPDSTDWSQTRRRYAAGRQTVWTATVLNTLAFVVVAIGSPHGLLMVGARPYWWPVWVLPVGFGSRFLGLSLRDRGGHHHLGEHPIAPS